MSQFYTATSIAALREQFLADADGGKPVRLFASRYGRDKPRFLDDDAKLRMRPTSKHLRFPLYEDEHGRQYTPEDEAQDKTDTWWVRIPPRFARRVNKRIRDGLHVDDKDVVDFPHAGDAVVLTTYRYSARDRDPRASVAASVLTLEYSSEAQASCRIVFTADVSTTRPPAHLREMDRRERRASVAEARSDSE
jgi:hypothetical protein